MGDDVHVVDDIVVLVVPDVSLSVRVCRAFSASLAHAEAKIFCREIGGK